MRRDPVHHIRAETEEQRNKPAPRLITGRSVPPYGQSGAPSAIAPDLRYATRKIDVDNSADLSSTAPPSSVSSSSIAHAGRVNRKARKKFGKPFCRQVPVIRHEHGNDIRLVLQPDRPRHSRSTKDPSKKRTFSRCSRRWLEIPFQRAGGTR